jgi:hypothetical protein
MLDELITQAGSRQPILNRDNIFLTNLNKFESRRSIERKAGRFFGVIRYVVMQCSRSIHSSPSGVSPQKIMEIDIRKTIPGSAVERARPLGGALFLPLDLPGRPCVNLIDRNIFRRYFDARG